MAWIEFHQTMPNHTKTLRLARELQITRFEAIGIMASLWCWALDVAAIDGVITGADAQDIADAIRYLGDPDKLITALISCGYMEQDGGHLILHDWSDYAGRLVEQRTIQKAQSRDRQRKRREKLRNGNVTRDTRVTTPLVTRDITVSHAVTSNEVTVPYPTVPLNILSDSKRKAENENPKKTTESRKSDSLVEEIVQYLNQKAGSAFRATTNETRKLIDGRISDGYTFQDFRRVIDDRCRIWKGDSKMEQYLRPSTLFRPANFESYINALPKEVNPTKEYFHSEIDVFGGRTR